MEGAVRKAILKPDESKNEVIAAIREVCLKLQSANTRFEMERDSDLIESSIYEIESLRAQYRYLLRIAREQGIKGGLFPAVCSDEQKNK
ncbi:MAG: DUF2508 family protein [Oscillospiraceae bacterium]|nr:DUF2508 family protein [Oscillospiraceae bacterium]MDD4413911.1 DUF2508 family protein [Oscillospiraceae bacterium]